MGNKEHDKIVPLQQLKNKPGTKETNSATTTKTVEKCMSWTLQIAEKDTGYCSIYSRPHPQFLEYWAKKVDPYILKIFTNVL
jgi:hypothetical protein